MYWVPTYDGAPIFGQAVRMQMVPNPTDRQITSFFGIEGLFSLYGGSRGRIFMIQAVLTGSDMPTLNANEALIHSYADGIGRALVDTRGRAWSNVVFDDDFHPDPEGPRPLVGYVNDDGEPYWALKYSAIFKGNL